MSDLDPRLVALMVLLQEKGILTEDDVDQIQNNSQNIAPYLRGF